MKRTHLTILGILTIVTASIYSCQKADFSSEAADEFPSIEELKQLDLGRVLFYDKHLSANNTVSCGSCHKQELAFADDVALSKGFFGKKTDRNSIAIQNIGGFLSFGSTGKDFFIPTDQSLFWDGRESNIFNMVMQPVAHQVEMGISSMDFLIERLSATEYYPDLFLQRFGTPEITGERISQAMGEFVMEMQSFDSRFDRKQFSTQELYGMQLFTTKYPCDQCHKVSNPGGYDNGNGDSTLFTNIGLGDSQDKGLGDLTGDPKDNGKFRVPSLRNIALTAPYMHDGGIETLEEVIEHYSNGMHNDINLDSKLKDENGLPLRMNISQAEKEAMVAFLQTFTDQGFISNPMLSDPF